MTKKQVLALIVALATFFGVMGGAAFLWLYAPYVKARLLLSTIDYHRGRNDDAFGPSMNGLQYWEMSLNTFTDDIDTWCIESLYTSTCERVQAEFGASEMSSYSYGDAFGYSRQVTVVQMRQDLEFRSYLVIEALHNNDNDMFRFEHREGTFDITGKTLLATWRLQYGLLRR